MVKWLNWRVGEWANGRPDKTRDRRRETRDATHSLFHAIVLIPDSCDYSITLIIRLFWLFCFFPDSLIQRFSNSTIVSCFAPPHVSCLASHVSCLASHVTAPRRVASGTSCLASSRTSRQIPLFNSPTPQLPNFPTPNSQLPTSQPLPAPSIHFPFQNGWRSRRVCTTGRIVPSSLKESLS